jgi:hypothetical protein
MSVLVKAPPSSPWRAAWIRYPIGGRSRDCAVRARRGRPSSLVGDPDRIPRRLSAARPGLPLPGRPTPDEIIAVMRRVPRSRHGARLGDLVLVLSVAQVCVSSTHSRHLPRSSSGDRSWSAAFPSMALTRGGFPTFVFPRLGPGFRRSCSLCARRQTTRPPAGERRTARRSRDPHRSRRPESETPSTK